MEILISHAELTLKGQNFNEFERVLRRNIRRAFLQQGLEIELKRDSRKVVGYVDCSKEKATQILQTVFGVHSFAFVDEVESKKESILSRVKQIVKNNSAQEFGVKVKRANKQLPFTSTDLSKDIGTIILNAGKKINLSQGEETIYVHVTKEKAYIHSGKIKGLGGLPVGTGGRVLLLLSGGIDSAVAAFLLMKRGCIVDFLHMHSLRNNELVKDSKVMRVLEKLLPYEQKARLYTVPYVSYQMKLAGKVYERYDLVLFKHFLLKLGLHVAKEFHYTAIATGDSVAQVASQTLGNLRAVSEGLNGLVIRPLAAYDKDEIIQLARKIGTFEITIEEYKDCCSLLAKNPTTSMKLEKMQELLKKVDVDTLVKEVVKEMGVIKVDSSTQTLK